MFDFSNILPFSSIEFYYFLSNSKDILSSSDLLNGIIHPTPFTNEYGSARATKNLLLIILNGILMINYLYKKKSMKKRKLFFRMMYSPIKISQQYYLQF